MCGGLYLTPLGTLPCFPMAAPSSELSTAEILAEIKFFTEKIECIDKEQGAYIGFQVKAGEELRKEQLKYDRKHRDNPDDPEIAELKRVATENMEKYLKASGGEDTYLQQLVLRRATFIEVVCKLTQKL